MANKLEIEQWSTQLRKGIAELCVLAAIKRLEDTYGYQLVQFLLEHEGLSFTESTVYPLLARLEREGLLTVTSRPSPSGPARRYYRITKLGEQALQAMLDQWATVAKSIRNVTNFHPNGEP